MSLVSTKQQKLDNLRLSNERLTTNEEAALFAHWLINLAVIMPVDDALANGYTVSSRDDNLDSTELGKVLDNYKLLDVLKRCVIESRTHGVSHLLPIYNVGNNKEVAFYSNPLNFDSVQEDSLLRFVTVSALHATPLIDQRVNDVFSKYYYRPYAWQMLGRTIHETHVASIRHVTPVNSLMQYYNYGGISLIQQIYDKVYKAETATNEAIEILRNMRMDVLTVNDKDLVLKWALIEQRLNRISEIRSNFKTRVIPDGEELQQITTPLAGIDEIVEQALMMVASAAQIPYGKLFKNKDVGGIGGKLEGSENIYLQTLNTIQSAAQPLLDFALKCAIRSIDKNLSIDDFSIAFNPAFVDSNEKVLANELVKSQILTSYYDREIIDEEDIKNQIRSDDNGIFKNIEL